MSKKVLKCPKCFYSSPLRANYCKNCGSKFTQEEKDKIYAKTIYFKLDKLKEWWDHITLSTITSHPFFRGAVIGLILGYGLANLLFMGSDFSINENNNYKVVYNQKAKEYYLIAKKDISRVPVDLYIPKRLDNLYILHYREDGVLLEKQKYNPKKPFSLTTYDEDYFIFDASYFKTKEKNAIKVYVYNEDKVDLEGNNIQ